MNARSGSNGSLLPCIGAENKRTTKGMTRVNETTSVETGERCKKGSCLVFKWNGFIYVSVQVDGRLISGAYDGWG